MQLILASQSPRRYEILSYFHLPFKQVSPLFDESSIPFRGDPKEYVQALARHKALCVSHQFKEAIIIAADTIVYREGKIYGKPKDAREGFDFLKELSGNWHSVFTGLALFFKDQSFERVEETKVLFNTLTEKQMHKYHDVLEFSDKAGGYMIQGAGSLIVKRIDGCYYNVMGLPVNALAEVMQEVGINLWDHLKS